MRAELTEKLLIEVLRASKNKVFLFPFQLTNNDEKPKKKKNGKIVIYFGDKVMKYSTAFFSLHESKCEYLNEHI